MKTNLNQLFLIFFLLLPMVSPHANKSEQLQINAQLSLQTMLKNIEHHYAYTEDKNIDWKCLNQKYNDKVKRLENRAEAVLFFEHLLLEFADNHMTLNTNIQESYRLNAPVFVKKKQSAFIIDDIWQTQLVDPTDLIIGAKLISINGMEPQKIIQDFPTHCLDKNQTNNQQWIINKALAGQYSKPRIIKTSTADNNQIIDLDQLQSRQTKQLLSSAINSEFGLITINNSLGQTDLIKVFDQTLDSLFSTKGLVLDLRNTINGGDSYIARAIIGRFIKANEAYQKHRFDEHRNGGPKVSRFWTEYVAPRKTLYDKPLVVLVNHWTGSMGEGLTIGLHGMQRGHVIGSEMAGLLGAVYGFQLEGMGFGYQMPAERLFHVDGTPRESFKPDIITKPNSFHEDAVLDRAIHWLKQQSPIGS